MTGGARAVFFDRDGTLMEEVNYCSDPARVRVYPGLSAALRELRDLGFRTFVITNQSAIGRGWMTDEQYQAVQREFLRQLGPHLIDASYYCGDAPWVPSTRRKPEPGMVLEAASEFGIDLAHSYFVGDKAVDMECGSRAGTRTILVMTGYGENADCRADFKVENAVQAILHILNES